MEFRKRPQHLRISDVCLEVRNRLQKVRQLEQQNLVELSKLLEELELEFVESEVAEVRSKVELEHRKIELEEQRSEHCLERLVEDKAAGIVVEEVRKILKEAVA